MSMAAVVALKVAEVAPEATVTDAGTVRMEFVLDRLTAAPPVGAPLLRVTVHVELLEIFKMLTTQARELTVGNPAPPVTIPPVAEDGTKVPVPAAAMVLVIPIAVVVTPVAMVRFTIATVPFAMIPAFNPETTHV